MGRSVSYPSDALVITFRSTGYDCEECGRGTNTDTEDCDYCNGTGWCEEDYDMLIDDFRDQLRVMFPSVVSADDWIDREDHVLAENKLARFGMSEYCGLVAYWIVPMGLDGYGYTTEAMQERWVKSIADKFVAAFGELSKVGSMSNGEGVYRRIDR